MRHGLRELPGHAGRRRDRMLPGRKGATDFGIGMRFRTYISAVAFVGSISIFHEKAIAEEPLELSIQDFAVDWDRYIGKLVRISGGRVNTATQTVTYYSTQGVSIIVEAPWSSRDDFKFVLSSL